jgi:hypothetical protein
VSSSKIYRADLRLLQNDPCQLVTDIYFYQQYHYTVQSKPWNRRNWNSSRHETKVKCTIFTSYSAPFALTKFKMKLVLFINTYHHHHYYHYYYYTVLTTTNIKQPIIIIFFYSLRHCPSARCVTAANYIQILGHFWQKHCLLWGHFLDTRKCLDWLHVRAFCLVSLVFYCFLFFVYILSSCANSPVTVELLAFGMVIIPMNQDCAKSLRCTGEK